MTTRSIRRIESEDNRLFKQLAQTLTGRGVRKHGVVLASGAKIVEDVLGIDPGRCEAWVGTSKLAPPPATLPARAAWYQLAPRLFRALDVSGTGSPLLLVRVPPLEAWRPEHGLPRGCTLLVPFQDPENVGAVIRSAAAFGVAQVVLLAESANPYHPKSVRASGGAVFTAALRSGPRVDELPDALPVIPLSPEGRSVETFAFPDRFALLPGVEGPGLRERFRSRALSVPMTGGVESLNAATATAIVMYRWSRAAREARA
jgi:tRNA G18 (ribose-2'-O)-methylase SpoU